MDSTVPSDASSEDQHQALVLNALSKCKAMKYGAVIALHTLEQIIDGLLTLKSELKEIIWKVADYEDDDDEEQDNDHVCGHDMLDIRHPIGEESLDETMSFEHVPYRHRRHDSGEQTTLDDKDYARIGRLFRIYQPLFNLHVELSADVSTLSDSFSPLYTLHIKLEEKKKKKKDMPHMSKRALGTFIRECEIPQCLLEYANVSTNTCLREDMNTRSQLEPRSGTVEIEHARACEHAKASVEGIPKDEHYSLVHGLLQLPLKFPGAIKDLLLKMKHLMNFQLVNGTDLSLTIDVLRQTQKNLQKLK
ncbi:hypothetical protein RFI_19894 [Reticulomyxa filosa]|uniref:Uncharacterized protein n=1 Tax=Reticulomyxa filosa TaxID=46433 RepID=X6MVG5_RETFI|nr:hypothetical protein RFI_19894 [Reticulomyxa filosa]|eukprot:ETO17427.1 hypothetical protein RFI_19894 [Reticulomyxa filosa]